MTDTKRDARRVDDRVPAILAAAEIVMERFGHALVWLDFMRLQEHALTSEAVLDPVQGGFLFADLTGWAGRVFSVPAIDFGSYCCVHRGLSDLEISTGVSGIGPWIFVSY